MEVISNSKKFKSILVFLHISSIINNGDIDQFLRSETSIGTNIREAFYAHGKADFVAKLHIALKECSETNIGLSF